MAVEIAKGKMKIYPACKMRAVDMAEMIKSVTMFEGVRRDGSREVPVNGGILQGCQMAIPQATPTMIRMSPGRILICGRLAEFTDEDDSGYIYLAPPSVNQTTTCIIVAVCDLTSPDAENGTGPFYIRIVTGTSTLDTAANLTTDEMFNANNGLRYLRLGTVKVSPNGMLSELTINHKSSDIKNNKLYVDGLVESLQNNSEYGNVILKDWSDYLRKARFRNTFVTQYAVSADGLTLASNTMKTFKFRKEYGSLVYINAQAIPYSDKAHVNIKADGTIISQKADTTPDEAILIDEHGVPQAIGTKYIHLGIVGVLIQAASSGSAAVEQLVIHSFYADSSNHVCVDIRNISSTPAKFKLTIRSIYVQDV